jgi:hypothetical protein
LLFRRASIVLSALLALAAVPPSLRAESQSLTILFGPNAPNLVRPSAHAAAAVARRWLKRPDTRVVLMQSGNTEAMPLSSELPAEDLASAFLDAATLARETDPAALLVALDTAIQAVAQTPGSHFLVAILAAPPFSSEAETRLAALVELGRANNVRVSVLDTTERDPAAPAAPLQALATRSGGLWIRRLSALESSLELLSPSKTNAPDQTETQAAAQPAASSAEAAQARSAASPAESGMDFHIPVYATFFRTSSRGLTSDGPNRADKNFSPNNSGMIGTGESTGDPNMPTGPLRGQVVVQAPLSALRFDTDDNAGTYRAHARITAIVRDAKRRSIWHIQQDVNLHGPLSKMKARLEGNLYLIRAVTIPGKVGFTLEGTVEDLLASSSGTVHQPINAVEGVPGLMVSDVCLARPFRGAADRLEADAPFNYDGEVLSPVLNPAFRAGEPFDINLYFVVYPDLRGGKPDLNFELLRGGKPVMRMPLPFKSELFDMARDGKTVSIMGGLSHEFSYLAALKGVKLGPGDFEARIIIRQGKNVVTRNVPLHVEGDAPVAAASANGAAASAADTEDIVLPEIEKIAVDAGAISPAAEEQARLWNEAAASALGYSRHLPNFRCNQETHRLKAPARTPVLLHEVDNIVDELVFEEGHETYRTLEVNGAKPEPGVELRGVRSRGEFGTMLQALFSPDTQAGYKWAGRAQIGGVLCQVFDVAVAQAHSNFVLYLAKRPATAGYTGRVYIEEETGMVRKLTIKGNGLPKDFGLQSPTFSLEYAMVRIGPQDYLLPLRSVLQLRQGKSMIRNEAVFREYRKFEASSKIEFHN